MTHRGHHLLATPAPRSPDPPRAFAMDDPGGLLDRLEETWRGGTRSLGAADAAALDALAASLARGAGATALAIGEGLDLLARTGGDVRLGWSGTGDVARELLGLPPDQGRRLRRIAERLRSRPLLRAAVVRGDVTLRKAEVVARRASGSEEAYWVARAGVDTVRRLEAAVGGEPEDPETDWHLLRIGLPAAEANAVEVALEVAGLVLGPTAPTWKRIGAIAMEFLGSHPIEPNEAIAPRPAPSPPARWAVRAAPAPSRDLPDRAAVAAPAPPPADPRDAILDAGSPAPMLTAAVAHPASPGLPPDPRRIVADLVALVRGRAGDDERLGRACLLVRRFASWRKLGHVSFEAWCADRLGLAPSTIRQRIALERRAQELPELREALRSGRLSYEQARLVAQVARRHDVAARIEEAAATTAVGYRRTLDAEADRQMWRARELRTVVPEEVDALVRDALRAARARLGPGVTPGAALVAISVEFVLTWEHEVLRQLGATHPVVLRDAGLCMAPGCSRPADHVHHVRRRSAGGPREQWNEISLCAIHHLRGVHGGVVEITGRAPDDLRFTVRPPASTVR
jgi:hypothetical protein